MTERPRRFDRSKPLHTLDQVIAARFGRRQLVRAGMGVSLLGFLGGCRTAGPGGAPPSPAVPGAAAPPGKLLGFASVPISRADEVVLPAGYRYRVVNAWGDPVVAGAPAWQADASQSAAVQALQAGMHHDGLGYFPLPRGSGSSEHGLLAVNFEYTDDNLLSIGGMAGWSAEKVQKSKNAHGIGVFEVRLEGGTWRTVTGSRYGRRLTADSPFALRGPAAGHPLLRTGADPQGRTVRGTFNNCAGGVTPWGTFLSCEENVTPYFVHDGPRGSDPASRLAERYGVPTSKEGWGYRWHEFDPRFDAAKHPHEPHRHGWVVEVDPYDPTSTPVKRTALGRLAHEGATVTLARDGRVVVYMGDDDFRSKFEHVYKFVSRRAFTGGGARENADLLDEGTLYVARFDADGTGAWLPLIFGEGGLGPAAGFASQAEVLVGARLAADTLGATYLDRPEWVAVHPLTGEVYLTLTNNSARGKGKPALRDQVLGADPVNPRAPNLMGHIVRWRERGGDPAALAFQWDLFLQAGDPGHADPDKRGNVPGAVAFAQPDGLMFDRRGVLWIQTDSSAQNMAGQDWAGIGNNQMLAADPRTGEVRRFLTGPVGCEITGMQLTPDLRTLFVNIQHPGEAPAAHPGRNDPANPQAHSRWPDGPRGLRPRSATIAIQRDDGGVIGS